MVDSYVSYFYMSGKDQKSPQNPQPKRKKIRVKSKQDTRIVHASLARTQVG